MELNKGALTWNLGDTSFRRKTLLDDYKILLSELNILNEDFDNEWNSEIQSEFYNRLVQNTELLKDKSGIANRTDKLARTYTNALYKLGLCNKKRLVSNVGLQYLGEQPFEMDSLEEKLLLKPDNIIFLRQLLKFGVCDKENNVVFNPFIILIKFLNRYEFLTKDEFVLIIHSCNGRTDYEKIFDEFKRVRNNDITLEEYISENLISDDPNVDDKENFINQEQFDEELFAKVFYNRKTAASVEVYKNFYKVLIKYNENNTEENLKELIPLIKNQAIKRAFKSSKTFNIKKIKGINVHEFNEITSSNKLVNTTGVEFRKSFTDLFFISKQEDLISEYVDMTFRVFNLTGIIANKNDKITIDRLYAKEYFKHIDSDLNPIVNDFSESNLFEIYSIEEILSTNKVEEVDELIKDKYKLESEADIDTFIKSKEDEAFEKFIKENFKIEKVKEILEYTKVRDDKSIFNNVTDQTTVPTIFEYILGIAWYHISDYKFNLYDSLNLTLDSNYYPLTHAAGGQGDIIINYNIPEKHTLMLEATLMDINNQKRGELEPVIRHTTNLTIENKETPTYTIFVANEVDKNVSNIFRFCDLIKLESSTDKGEFTDSTKIVALTIDEVISLLDKKIKYEKVYEEVNKEFKIKDLSLLNNGWRERFVSNILG